MSRRRGSYRSPVLSEAETDAPQNIIYNVFLDIEEPFERAYYLPVIDAVFLPPMKSTNFRKKMLAVAWHERTHSIQAQTVSGCEQRALATEFLSDLVNFATSISHSDIRISVPSFKVINPREDIIVDLANIADRFDSLSTATEVVQEIVALTVALDGQEWNRARSRQVIERVIAELTDAPVPIDDFLDVYEHVGILGACTLGFYALNEHGLTPERALSRLRQAIQVANQFTHPDTNDTTPFGQIFVQSRLVEHLTRTLPDCNWLACPLAGSCLPLHLDSLRASGEHDRSSSLGDRVLSNGAALMRYVRCNRVQTVQEGGALPRRAKITLQELIRDKPHLAKHLAIDNRSTYSWPLLNLRLTEVDQRNHHWVVARRYQQGELLRESWLPSAVMLEALRQQMWAGQGPHCFCYPFPQEDCGYRSLLHQIWDCTEGDSMSQWKKQRPVCLSR